MKAYIQVKTQTNGINRLHDVIFDHMIQYLNVYIFYDKNHKEIYHVKIDRIKSLDIYPEN